MHSQPVFDRSKSFEENIEQGPFFTGVIPKRAWPSKEQWINFLGYNIASRIGVAACPFTATSKGVALAARLGFDVITYKTICSAACPVYPFPNVTYVTFPEQLSLHNIDEPIQATDKKPNSCASLAVANSIGNASQHLEQAMADIHCAKQSLANGQLLIVSVFGLGECIDEVIKDFIHVAFCAQDAGADIIEANFSCPNIPDQSEMIFLEPERVFAIASSLVHALNSMPLIIKVGLFPNQKCMRDVLCAAARAGVRGICSMNTVGMQVINSEGKPFFGEKRKIAGVSGAPIRSFALQQMREMAHINEQEKLGLTFVAVGGITVPEHIDLFIEAGADVALSATGAMWNPYLATEYHEKKVIRNALFEFEAHGDINALQELMSDLFEHLGFGSKELYQEGDYPSVAERYKTKEIEAEQEEKIRDDFSHVFFLKYFPFYSHPFFNMKKVGDTANKIDAILYGMETVGSAERSCNPDEMREMFHTISNGQYAQLLFDHFGKERVLKELDEFLSLDFFPRFGGGIGVNRLMRAMELAKEEHPYANIGVQQQPPQPMMM